MTAIGQVNAPTQADLDALDAQYLDTKWVKDGDVWARIRPATQYERAANNGYGRWIIRKLWVWSAGTYNLARLFYHSMDYRKVMEPWPSLEGSYLYTRCMLGKTTTVAHHPVTVKALFSHARNDPANPTAPLSEGDPSNPRPLHAFITKFFPQWELSPEDVVMTSSGENHTRLHESLVSYFTPQRIKEMRGEIQQVVKDHIDGWIPTSKFNGGVHLNKVSRLFSATIMSKLFLGREEPFDDICEAVDTMVYHLIEFSLKKAPKYPEKVEKAQRVLAQAVEDVLQKDDNFVAAMRVKGLTEKQIKGHLFMLLFGGHETTATALLYSILKLAQDPSEQEKIKNEILGKKEECPESEEFHMEEVARSLASVKERINLTLLECPPAWGVARVPKDDDVFEIKDEDDHIVESWYIYKGDKLAAMPAFAAMQVDRDKAKTASFAGYNWFPFGGFEQLCPGWELAMAENAQFLATLVDRCVLSTDFKGKPTQTGLFVTSIKEDIKVKVVARD